MTREKIKVTYHFHQVSIDQFVLVVRLRPLVPLVQVGGADPDDVVTMPGDPGGRGLVPAVAGTGAGAVLPLVVSRLGSLGIPVRIS